MSHPPCATATRLLAQWGHVGSRGGGCVWALLVTATAWSNVYSDAAYKLCSGFGSVL